MKNRWKILLCLPALGAAEPNSTLIYKPASEWMFYDLESSCILQREFKSSHGAPALVRLERFALPPTLELWLVGPEIQLYPRARLVDVKFGSLAPMYKAPIAVTTGGSTSDFFWIGGEWPTSKTAGEDASLEVKRAMHNLVITPDDENASATVIDSLWVSAGLKQDVRFQLESMVRPMSTLHHCVERHLAKWGLDVEAHRTLSRQAAPEDESALFSSIYHDGQHGRTRFGLVRFRVMVDPMGKATACVVMQQKGDTGLGAATCKSVLERATFHPALDHAGKPVASVWFSQVSFG